MIMAVWDFHVASPWASRARQNRVLDMIEARAPAAVFFCGDTFEELTGVRAMVRCQVFRRLREIAQEIDVHVLPGNFPHDDRAWLDRIDHIISPMLIWPEDYFDIVADGVTYRLTHGAEFDGRVALWNRFRWASEHLPWIARHILPALPSDLVGMGRRNAGSVINRIHNRAKNAGLDADAIVLIGHTHATGYADDLDSGYAAMGASGCDQGPAYIAILDPATGYDRISIPQPAQIAPVRAMPAHPAPTPAQAADRVSTPEIACFTATRIIT